MCDVVEYSDDQFRIIHGEYQSDYYSDLKDLRMYDISILRDDSKYSSIPFDIYIYSTGIQVIARKTIQFKIDKHHNNIGEYWLTKYGNEFAVQWSVFDYDFIHLFSNNLMKCGVTSVIQIINEIEWRDFEYDNAIIPWIVNNLNLYCKKNVSLPLELPDKIVTIVWDYILCNFDDIEF